MSSGLYESVVVPPEPTLEGCWRGRIARGATDMAERVWVVIPGFDDTRQIGPYRWMPRDETAKPQRGDYCLVLFDEQQEGHVVYWGPQSG